MVMKRATKCERKDLRGAEFEFHDARTHRSQQPTVTGLVTSYFTVNDSIDVRHLSGHP